jgi:hypothetical protein
MVPLIFEAELWRYPGESGWCFVTLPVTLAEEIRELTDGGTRRGFGSVRVSVTVGSTTWSTSVFPDSSSGSYVLPVKQAVRRAESLEVGDPVPVSLTLLI